MTMNDNQIKVDSLENLLTILSQYNIDISQWNHQDGNKNIEDLWLEIQEGESQLKLIQDKIVRLLRVSSIEVFFPLGNHLFKLVEDKQIFFTGKVRKRDINSITEKLKGKETPLDGAYRALEEEIGLKTTKDLAFMGETYWEKISPSYPDLLTLYQVFNYQIFLGEKELSQVRFSEYNREEKMLNLFTLIPNN